MKRKVLQKVGNKLITINDVIEVNNQLIESRDGLKVIKNDDFKNISLKKLNSTWRIVLESHKII